MRFLLFQVASVPQPTYLVKEDIPENVIEKEKEILREQVGEGKILNLVYDVPPSHKNVFFRGKTIL